MNLEDLGNLGNFGTALSKTYPLHNASVQNVAYALSEYLDTKKNMITQTMRTRNGYLVQCKGDANADWTKYIGLDASVDIKLIPMEKDLIVEITTGKWLEKLGIAAAGAILFQPLLITSGIGAIRQMALPDEIFSFISDYLGEEPVTRSVEEEEARICPKCGTANSMNAKFCSQCGEAFAEPQPEPKTEPVCPQCGTPLKGSEKFCSNCGKKLSD